MKWAAALALAGCAVSGNVGQRDLPAPADDRMRAVQVEVRTETYKTPLPGWFVRVVGGDGVVVTVETNAIGMAFAPLRGQSISEVLIQGDRTGPAWGRPARVRLHSDGDPWRLVVEVPEAPPGDVR